MFFTHSVIPLLSGSFGAGAGAGALPTPPVSANTRVEIAMPIPVRIDAIEFLAQEQGANALSQCGVFMEEPAECLTDSVDLRPDGCSVRREGFEPCLPFKLDVRYYTRAF